MSLINNFKIRYINIEKILVFLLILSTIVFYTNPKFNLLYKAIYIVFVVGILGIKIIRKERILINKFDLWIVMFFMLSLASLLWSINYQLYIIRVILLNMIILITLNIWIDNQNKLEFIFKCIIISDIILTVYIISKLGIENMFNSRLLVDGYNANSVGIVTAISCVLLTFFVCRYKKLILIPIYIYMIIFIFITGSKKSLFVLIVCVCGYLIWKNKSIAKKILNLLIALSLIFILINALFKVEFIYKIIGVRVESFINGLLMGTKGDDDIRYKFAELGIQYFMQNPILGVGIDNYRFKLLYDIGLDTYSHNNYVEILSNLGIIGFVSYYWIYIYILIRVFKEYIYANDKSLIIIGLLVMVSIVIMELGLITYDYPYMQVMILLCYKISYLHEDKYRQEVEVQNEIRNIK